jgi:hypothetical protein
LQIRDKAEKVDVDSCTLNTALATPKTDKYTHDKHKFRKNKWKELFTVYMPRITAEFDIVTKKTF